MSKLMFVSMSCIGNETERGRCQKVKQARLEQKIFGAKAQRERRKIFVGA